MCPLFSNKYIHCKFCLPLLFIVMVSQSNIGLILRGDAMGCGQDILVTYNGASTELTQVTCFFDLHYSNHPRVLVDWSLFSVDNLRLQRGHSTLARRVLFSLCAQFFQGFVFFVFFTACLIPTRVPPVKTSSLKKDYNEYLPH